MNKTLQWCTEAIEIEGEAIQALREGSCRCVYNSMCAESSCTNWPAFLNAYSKQIVQRIALSWTGHACRSRNVRSQGSAFHAPTSRPYILPRLVSKIYTMSSQRAYIFNRWLCSFWMCITCMCSPWSCSLRKCRYICYEFLLCIFQCFVKLLVFCDRTLQCSVAPNTVVFGVTLSARHWMWRAWIVSVRASSNLLICSFPYFIFVHSWNSRTVDSQHHQINQIKSKL